MCERRRKLLSRLQTVLQAPTEKAGHLPSLRSAANMRLAKNARLFTNDREAILQHAGSNADITDMTDPQRRALRTLLQAVVGALGAGLVNVLAPDGLDPEWLAVIGVVLTTIFTQLQNSLEDSGRIPALLKAPASDGVDPLPDPEE